MKQLTSAPLFDLKAVSFHYPDGSVGLAGCSSVIHRGTRLALLGANGAGKTTLFLHLNGILRPQSGRLLFSGAPMDYSRQGLHALRCRVGMVFQNPDSQLFSASVGEDVSFGPLNLGLDNATAKDRVEEALAAVGMTPYADKPVHNLSYGQKKRVCIAGVLAMRPEVLILDEPMAGLDVAMQSDLTQILNQLHTAGMTIIIATHDIDFAYQWADTLTAMVNGKCAASWDVESIPAALEELATYGLGVPKVAELDNLLTTQSRLTRCAPAARSHQDLLKKLRVAL